MSDDLFKQRIANLRLHGVLAHWSELATADWLPQLVAWEEEERTRRSLEKRMRDLRAVWRSEAKRVRMVST